MKRIKITLVGDIFPSNTWYTRGFGNAKIELKSNFSDWTNNLKEKFKDSDIIFGNLEAPLLEPEKKAAELIFAGYGGFAKSLKYMGFNLVSVANNHILEHGEQGLLSTKDSLFESGVGVIGVLKDDHSNFIKVFNINNKKIGFSGFNGVENIPQEGLIPKLSMENIKNTLDEMKQQKLDYKILSFHWGDEYIDIPAAEQVELAHKTIDYGADIIIGHHPHVIQPVEYYKQGLIIYSLGNFVFDFLYSHAFKLGMMVNVYLKDNAEIEYELLGVDLDNNLINSIGSSPPMYKHLEKSKRRMDQMLLQPVHKYQVYYKKKLLFHRFHQRILMKMYLILLLIYSKNRMRILANIYKKIFSSGLL